MPAIVVRRKKLTLIVYLTARVGNEGLGATLCPHAEWWTPERHEILISSLVGTVSALFTSVEAGVRLTWDRQEPIVPGSYFDRIDLWFGSHKWTMRDRSTFPRE